MAEPQDDRRAARQEQRRAAYAGGQQQAQDLELARTEALGFVKSDAFWRQILESLPKTLDNEWFKNVTLGALMLEPKLLHADRRSLANALIYAARMGLMPGPGYGEIALFVDGKNNVQHRTMYRGVLKLVRNTTKVADIDAQTVYRNDPCKILVGKMPHHEIPLDAERGDIRGCYAYARLHGSDHHMVEYMSWDQIWAHAKRYSDALKQGRDTPWKDDEAKGEMGCKTVLLRLMKMLPQSPEVVQAIEDMEKPDDDPALRARVVNGPQQAALPQPQPTTMPSGWGRQWSGGNGGEEPSQPAQEAQGEAAEPSGHDRGQERAAPAQEASGGADDGFQVTIKGIVRRQRKRAADDLIEMLREECHSIEDVDALLATYAAEIEQLGMHAARVETAADEQRAKHQDREEPDGDGDGQPSGPLYILRDNSAHVIGSYPAAEWLDEIERRATERPAFRSGLELQNRNELHKLEQECGSEDLARRAMEVRRLLQN